GAVPRTTACKLDGGAGIQNADEIFPAMAQQVASRPVMVEAVDHPDRRPFTRSSDRTRYRLEHVVAIFDRGEQWRDSTFSFALQHTIDGTFGMTQECVRDERRAMAADEHGTVRQYLFRQLSEVHNFGHIRKIVTRKPDSVGSALTQQAYVISVRLDLQINQCDVVTECLCCRRD